MTKSYIIKQKDGIKIFSQGFGYLIEAMDKDDFFAQKLFNIFPRYYLIFFAKKRFRKFALISANDFLDMFCISVSDLCKLSKPYT